MQLYLYVHNAFLQYTLLNLQCLHSLRLQELLDSVSLQSSIFTTMFHMEKLDAKLISQPGCSFPRMLFFSFPSSSKFQRLHILDQNAPTPLNMPVLLYDYFLEFVKRQVGCAKINFTLYRSKCKISFTMEASSLLTVNRILYYVLQYQFLSCNFCSLKK